MLSHSGVPGEIEPSRISGSGGVCFPVAISPNASKSKRSWSINIVDEDECRPGASGAAWRRDAMEPVETDDTDLLAPIALRPCIGHSIGVQAPISTGTKYSIPHGV